MENPQVLRAAAWKAQCKTTWWCLRCHQCVFYHVFSSSLCVSERDLDLREVEICISMWSLCSLCCCWVKASARLSRLVGGTSASAHVLPHLACSDLWRCLRNVEFCWSFSAWVGRDGFLHGWSFWKSETKLWTSVRLQILLISGCFHGLYKQKKDCYQIDHGVWRCGE